MATAIDTSPRLQAIASIALAACTLSIGYFVGARVAARWRMISGAKQAAHASSVSRILDDCKLALVVRTDLGMSTGKIAAQCSHATLACYKSLSGSDTKLLRHWEKTGQTKVVLRCGGEEDLLTLQAQAQSLNLCAHTIQDAGRTQIAAGSRTVLGILGPTKLVDEVTSRPGGFCEPCCRRDYIVPSVRMRMDV